MKSNQFLTVKQTAEEYGWPLGGLRGILANRKHNGLEQAVIRIGRKLLIDRERFNLWLREHLEEEKNITTN